MLRVLLFPWYLIKGLIGLFRSLSEYSDQHEFEENVPLEEDESK